jgi:hypothetical protein
LSAVGPGGIPIFVQGEFRQRVDGDGSASEQEITGVAPGTYQLNRQTFNDSGEMSVDEEETVSVSSGGAVPLTQANTTRLHGRVVFTSGEPQQIALRFIGDRVRRMAVVQQDGAFTMPRPLPPGRYKLAAVGLPGLSVQSVSAANQASIGSILTIPNHAPGSLDLTVTVGTAATSTVSGVVLRGGKPLDSVMVLLLPSDFADTATIGRDQSDSDGTFSIANVQAGRYTLLALDCEDGAADLEYQNAAVMKPYLPHGQLVTIPLAADKPLVVEATACR